MAVPMSKPVSMGAKPASPTTPQLQKQRGDMIMQRMDQAKKMIGRPAPRPGMGAPVQGPGGMPRGVRSFPAPPQGGMRPGAEPVLDGPGGDMVAKPMPPGAGGGLPPRLQEAVQAGRLSPEQAGERFAQFQAGSLPGQQDSAPTQRPMGPEDMVRMQAMRAAGGGSPLGGAPDMTSGGIMAPGQAPGMAPPMGGGQMPSQGAGAANPGMPGGGSPQPRPFNIQSLADLYQMAQGGGMGNPQGFNMTGRPFPGGNVPNPAGGGMPVRPGGPGMGGFNPYSR